jgi:polar amino acid transport system ATP-binding protein
LIQIRDVSKWYGDFRVLHNINEEIKLGQTVVVCGPSGSGKSKPTSINCGRRSVWSFSASSSIPI